MPEAENHKWLLSGVDSDGAYVCKFCDETLTFADIAERGPEGTVGMRWSVNNEKFVAVLNSLTRPDQHG